MAAALEASQADYASLRVSELEERLRGVEDELVNLASISFRSGVGSVGYRSKTSPNASSSEWVQIDFGEEHFLDEVIIVPTIWRDTVAGFRADGFPVELRVVVGTQEKGNERIIAEFTEADQLLPRIAPLAIPCEQIKASWLRLETRTLSARQWDGLYLLQLSEILVFSGNRNVALGQQVSTSSESVEVHVSRRKEHLVDGFTPYLMNASKGEKSLAFVSDVKATSNPQGVFSIDIDLEEERLLDGINLHAIELSDTVPQTLPVGFGFAGHIQVQGAQSADFEDAQLLTEIYSRNVYEIGPILMRQFPPSPCRFVRVVLRDAYATGEGESKTFFVGFAELELTENGLNVSLGKPVKADELPIRPVRSLRSLTDGHNYYGEILPIRRWMAELSKRHDLERERIQLRSILEQRYTLQRKNLNRMRWLAALLGAGIVFTILTNRLVRMRHVAQVRERLAADLHDELGANLHTIGLLSDLAAEAAESPDELAILHRRIRSETERSGAAVRYCTDMLEARGGNSDLEEDMKRAARRILSSLDHQLTIEGKDALKQLEPRVHQDLFLFYKECLVNISRHADATKYSTSLRLERNQLRLEVSDNGKGIEGEPAELIPVSIKRRARLLQGKVKVESKLGVGTQVILTLNLGPQRTLKQLFANWLSVFRDDAN